MAITPIPTCADSPRDWGIAPEKWRYEDLSSSDQQLISIDGFLKTPDHAISHAVLQNFARITPQYPGVRAALPARVCADWLTMLAPLLDHWFGAPAGGRGWAMQAWYSLVTTPPHALIPMQRLPHVDGTDPAQIAMMLYLSPGGPHGGTAFFRHLSTGLEALTGETYPRYAAAVQADHARTGMPPAAYPTDGAPHFARTHVAEGRFNRAIFYRGNILHSGVIDNFAPLGTTPADGRLTINAFFRPAAE